MATLRLMRTSTPPSAQAQAHGAPSLSTTKVRIRNRVICMAVGFGSENIVKDVVEKKPVPTKIMVAALDLDCAPTQTSERVDLAILMVYIRIAIGRKLKVATKRRSWSLIIQSQLEKVIMDCRFFAMLGVAGSLLGSVLCFLEGVFLVMESYLQYFHAMAHHSDHGQMIYLLIQALDMFLIGSTMLTFGMGLHVMFVKGSSNNSGLFYLKEIPSISEAKTKMGHGLMLLLQVGVLEKMKSMVLVTGLDLAYFAASIFVSSAALFILSRLH